MAEIVVSLVIAAVGTAGNVRNNRKAASARRKSERLNRRQNDLENQRRIRQAVAQGRIERARVLSASAGQGVDDSSSAVQGGVGAAQTQLGANVGFAQQTADANASANRLIAKSNASLNRAQNFQALGNLPTQFGFSPGDSVRQITKNQGLKASKVGTGTG